MDQRSNNQNSHPTRALLFFLAMLICVNPLFAHAMVVDRVVAVVNQEIITLSELEQVNAKLGNPLFGQLALGSSRLSDRQPLHETLRLLIEKRLQLQAARKIGITVNQEELQQALEEIKNSQGIRDDVAFQRLLSRDNLSLSDYTQELKDQLMIFKLITREIHSGVVLHEGEISTYYNSHPEHFRRPERVRLAQILLTISPQAAEAEIHRVEQQARQIHTRLLSGEDFGTVAADFSGLSDAQQGIDLGYFKKGELLEIIDKEVFSLKAGDITDVIRTDRGFHIFKILEKETAQTIPYEEVKEQVKEMIFSERSDMAYRQWLKRLRDQAYVEIRM